MANRPKLRAVQFSTMVSLRRMLELRPRRTLLFQIGAPSRDVATGHRAEFFRRLDAHEAHEGTNVALVGAPGTALVTPSGTPSDIWPGKSYAAWPCGSRGSFGMAHRSRHEWVT